MLTVAISPCPNDIFIFHGWFKKFIPQAPEVTPIFADIQRLNEWALEGRYPIMKVSCGCLDKILDDYVVLPSGTALGHKCGPKLVANSAFLPEEIVDKKIAVPGIDTTANRLMQLLLPPPLKKVYCTYDQVLNLVQTKTVDAGLIIHESRFTFAKTGLIEIVDLGELWESHFKLPIPLGCIVGKRSLGNKMLQRCAHAISESLKLAWQQPTLSRDYILQHSQEKQEEIVNQHIDLYVTKNSLELSQEGTAAIETLLQKDKREWLY